MLAPSCTVSRPSSTSQGSSGVYTKRPRPWTTSKEWHRPAGPETVRRVEAWNCSFSNEAPSLTAVPLARHATLSVTAPCVVPSQSGNTSGTSSTATIITSTVKGTPMRTKSPKRYCRAEHQGVHRRGDRRHEGGRGGERDDHGERVRRGTAVRRWPAPPAPSARRWRC